MAKEAAKKTIHDTAKANGWFRRDVATDLDAERWIKGTHILEIKYRSSGSIASANYSTSNGGRRNIAGADKLGQLLDFFTSGLAVGTKVTIRPSGITGTVPEDAIWEITNIHFATRTCALRLIGSDHTCGAHLTALIPAN